MTSSKIKKFSRNCEETVFFSLKTEFEKKGATNVVWKNQQMYFEVEQEKVNKEEENKFSFCGYAVRMCGDDTMNKNDQTEDENTKKTGST